MSIKVTDPSDKARLAAANYIVLAKSTERALRSAQELLIIRRGGFADLQETREINAKLPDLVSAQAAIEAELNAFLAQAAAIQAPTDADLKTALRLAEQLDAMNASSTNATAILGAAQQLAGIWASTRG